MAIKKLTELPTIGIPTTGDVTYLVNNTQSFQATMDRLSNTMISAYNLLTNILPANLMTSGNAELILNGLNIAPSAKLNQDKVDVDWNLFVSGYFDIDGGTFYDTYTNTSTFDGGPIV